MSVKSPRPPTKMTDHPWENSGLRSGPAEGCSSILWDHTRGPKMGIR